MFDLGWQEFFLIAVVAIIVVGPKDLPQALRTVTHFIRKIRGLAREFQSGIDELVREAELDDIKRQVNSAQKVDYSAELKKAVDPDGRLTEDFDPRQFNKELMRRIEGESPDHGDTARPDTARGARAEGHAERRVDDAPTLTPPSDDKPLTDIGRRRGGEASESVPANVDDGGSTHSPAKGERVTSGDNRADQEAAWAPPGQSGAERRS